MTERLAVRLQARTLFRSLWPKFPVAPVRHGVVHGKDAKFLQLMDCAVCLAANAIEGETCSQGKANPWLVRR